MLNTENVVQILFLSYTQFYNIYGRKQPQKYLGIDLKTFINHKYRDLPFLPYILKANLKT